MWRGAKDKCERQKNKKERKKAKKDTKKKTNSPPKLSVPEKSVFKLNEVMVVPGAACDLTEHIWLTHSRT